MLPHLPGAHDLILLSQALVKSLCFRFSTVLSLNSKTIPNNAHWRETYSCELDLCPFHSFASGFSFKKSLLFKNLFSFSYKQIIREQISLNNIFDYKFGTVGFAFSLLFSPDFSEGHIIDYSHKTVSRDAGFERQVVIGDPSYEEPEFNLLSYEVEWEWGVPYLLARLSFDGDAAPSEDEIIEIYQPWDYEVFAPPLKKIFGGRVLSKRIISSPPNRIRQEIVAVSAGYTLTQQYINSSTSLIQPGETPNPKEYIKQWLGDSDWRMITGCEAKWIAEVPNWRSEYAWNFISFSPARTTKWEAISMICDKYNMCAWVTPHWAFDWNEFRFYDADYARRYIFDKKLNVSGDKSIKSVEVYEERGKWYQYNRVRVFSSAASEWDYFWAQAETNSVKWKDVRPIEYNFALPDLEDPANASVWARALLDRFQLDSRKVTITTRVITCHSDGSLVKPGDQIRIYKTFLPDGETFRIYKITHRRSSGSEPETTFEAAKWDDLSHPYVPSENPFRRLRDEVYEKILRATLAVAKVSSSRLVKSHASMGAATGSAPCEIINVNDDGTVDVKILTTNQIIKRVNVL